MEKNGEKPVGTASGAPVLRVMLVDDDPFVRDVAAVALAAAEGVTVAAYATGAAALAALDDFAPNLLVLDLMMPGMDGRAVWRSVAERGRKPRLIFLTGQDDDATRAEVAALGAEGLIAKPFDPAAFAGTVLGLAEKSRVRAARRDALARDFAANLPLARAAVERAWGKLARWDASTAETLLAEVHKIAGVAPMFGFKDVGVAADRTEGLLRAALSQGGWRGDAERGTIAEAVRGLSAAIEKSS